MKQLLTMSLIITMILGIISCDGDKKEKAKLIISNSTGGDVTATVDGTNYSLEIGGTKNLSWELNSDDSKDIIITAEGSFLMDYETTRNVYGGYEGVVEINANATCVRIVNQTGSTITEVYISKYTATTWGPNLLEDGTTISASGTKDFTMEAYSYDLMVKDSGGTTYTISWLDISWFNIGEFQVINVGTAG